MLDKMKARFGSLSPKKLAEIKELSPSAYEILVKVTDLIKVAEAAASVLSEEGVKEYLCSYVMGVELIDRLDALHVTA